MCIFSISAKLLSRRHRCKFMQINLACQIHPEKSHLAFLMLANPNYNMHLPRKSLHLCGQAEVCRFEQRGPLSLKVVSTCFQTVSTLAHPFWLKYETELKSDKHNLNPNQISNAPFWEIGSIEFPASNCLEKGSLLNLGQLWHLLQDPAMCSKWLWLVKGFHIAMYLPVSSNIQVSDAPPDSYIEGGFSNSTKWGICVPGEWALVGVSYWHHRTSGLLSCPDILLQFLKHLTSQSSLAWTFVGYSVSSVGKL